MAWHGTGRRCGEGWTRGDPLEVSDLNALTADVRPDGAASRPRPVMVVVPPGLVPRPWRDRAVECCAIWLDPEELDLFLGEGPDTLPHDLRPLVPLVVSGLTANAIATRLHVSPRTVHRRLQRLRRFVGAASHVELVAALAGRNGTAHRA